MATMIREVYEALREAGTSEERAISDSEAIEKGRQATKDDIHKLELTLKEDNKKLELKLKDVEIKLEKQIQSTREELKSDMQKMRTQIILVKWMSAVVIAATVIPFLRDIFGG